MKVNVGIELTDEQRNALADWLDGKQTKRLATRRDVNELVTGLLAGIVDSSAHVEPGPTSGGITKRPAHATLPAEFEREVAAQIKRRGYNANEAKSYRRGWTMRPFKR